MAASQSALRMIWLTALIFGLEDDQVEEVLDVQVDQEQPALMGLDLCLMETGNTIHETFL